MYFECIGDASLTSVSDPDWAVSDLNIGDEPIIGLLCFCFKNWVYCRGTSRFNCRNRNGFSFPFLSFQARILMQTNLGPFIIAVLIGF